MEQTIDKNNVHTFDRNKFKNDLIVLAIPPEAFSKNPTYKDKLKALIPNFKRIEKSGRSARPSIVRYNYLSKTHFLILSQEKFLILLSKKKMNIMKLDFMKFLIFWNLLKKR